MKKKKRLPFFEKITSAHVEDYDVFLFGVITLLSSPFANIVDYFCRLIFNEIAGKFSPPEVYVLWKNIITLGINPLVTAAFCIFFIRKYAEKQFALSGSRFHWLKSGLVFMIPGKS